MAKGIPGINLERESATYDGNRRAVGMLKARTGGEKGQHL